MLPFLRPAAFLIAALAILTAALASHTPWGDCDSDGHPAVGIVEITSGEASPTFYLDDRNAVFGNDVWIWEETNGLWTAQGAGIHTGDVTEHNLQRGHAGHCFDCDHLCVDDPTVIPDIAQIWPWWEG